MSIFCVQRSIQELTPSNSGKYDREIHVFHEGVRETLHEDVRHYGSDSANEEEEDEAIINLALRKLALRSNDSPDEGCGAEYFRIGANELIRLVGRAHIPRKEKAKSSKRHKIYKEALLDVGEHPGLNTKLCSSGEHRGNDLTEKQSSWRYYQTRLAR